MHLRLNNLTAILISAAFSLVLISITAQAQTSEIRRSYDFRQGALNWQADFVGYTNFNQDIYEMVADVRPLPTELGISGTGFYFQAHNRCDCLDMFLKRRLDAADGIVAGQRYRVSYTVTLASNAQNGCVGAGGAPGESVRLYFGGSQVEPVTFTGPHDTRRLNVESTVGSEAGNIANGRPCANPKPFVSIQRTHQHTAEITANAAGELWMYVGTDPVLKASPNCTISASTRS